MELGLLLVSGLVFFSVLYFVVKAAVRDGILAAQEIEKKPPEVRGEIPPVTCPTCGKQHDRGLSRCPYCGCARYGQ